MKVTVGYFIEPVMVIFREYDEESFTLLWLT